MTTPTTAQYDILIIGAGPAGLSTALHLARDFPHLAQRTLILEKERHPRPKLCAGGLTRDAEAILRQLQLDAGAIPHVDAPSIHFDFLGRGLSIRDSQLHALRIIRRDEFDAWLAGKAREKGIQIWEQVTVKEVRPDENGVTVLTDAGEFRARVVVGADGSKGVTRRCVLPHAPVRTARALEVIVPGSSQRTLAAFFDFFPIPKNIAGYTWDFPTQIKGEPSRCWGVYDANLSPSLSKPPLKEILAAEMARCGLHLDDFPLNGHPIRWFEPWTKMAVPRVLLAGDAAGADPLFGEGISLALGYGALAAREIGTAFERGDFSFHGYHQRTAHSGLGQTLFTRWLIAQIIYSIPWTWFQILLWRILKPIVLIIAWVFVLNWAGRMPKPKEKKFKDRQ